MSETETYEHEYFQLPKSGLEFTYSTLTKIILPD